MNKRGQVTIFIILGIIIVAIVAFLLIGLQRGIIIRPFTPSQTVSVRDTVATCIEETADEAIFLVGVQGGDVQPIMNSQPFYTYNVTYLCHTESFAECQNKRPFLKEHIEKEIEDYLNFYLRGCVDPAAWEDSGYVVNLGSIEDVKVSLGNYNVLVEVDWPITITKDDLVESEDSFAVVIEKPLGKLIETSKDIVESEIATGDFLIIPYVVSERGKVIIQRERLFDRGKVYILNLAGDDYTFQFAVKGWTF